MAGNARRRAAKPSKFQRTQSSLAQIKADVARRQAEYREVRVRQAKSDEPDAQPSGPSRVHIDFEDLIEPFQAGITRIAPKEGPTRG